ncbi:hypothetical protein ATKI12_6285 [Kitasatospora sp. Ki12]
MFFLRAARPAIRSVPQGVRTASTSRPHPRPHRVRTRVRTRVR